MRYGRVDAELEEDCTPPGNLPAAKAPFPREATNPQQHLRDTFYRMGLDDRDIVALRYFIDRIDCAFAFCSMQRFLS